jgi:hypothetical protein
MAGSLSQLQTRFTVPEFLLGTLFGSKRFVQQLKSPDPKVDNNRHEQKGANTEEPIGPIYPRRRLNWRRRKEQTWYCGCREDCRGGPQKFSGSRPYAYSDNEAVKNGYVETGRNCDIDNKHKEAQSTNQCFRMYGLDADMLVRHLGNPQSQVGPPEFYLKSHRESSTNVISRYQLNGYLKGTAISVIDQTNAG